MTTRDLAKELDSLARTLRGMSSEAQEAVEVKLDLKYARTLQDLTLARITAAGAAATKQAGSRARELRKDVFDRRCENLSVQFAAKLRGLARAGAGAINGDVLSLRLTGRPAGQTWYGDVVRRGDHTPVAAEVYAWIRAARDAVRLLVPAYGFRELERVANERVGASGFPGDTAHRMTDSWRISQKFDEELDEWVTKQATLRVRLEGGKVAQVWGLDPTPYVALLAELAAGNPDPIGIFGAQFAPCPS